MVVYYKIFFPKIPSQNSKVITFEPNGKTNLQIENKIKQMGFIKKETEAWKNYEDFSVTRKYLNFASLKLII